VAEARITVGVFSKALTASNPPSGCNTAGLVMPTFEYSHGVNDANGCSIIGGHVYRGKRLPILVGRYFFGDLCGGWVKSFRLQGVSQLICTDYTPEFGGLSAYHLLRRG